MKKRKAILVVDPFISPEYLCQRLKAEGYEVIVLKTIKDVPAYFDYSAIPATIIESSGHVHQDILTLKSYPIT